MAAWAVLLFALAVLYFLTPNAASADATTTTETSVATSTAATTTPPATATSTATTTPPDTRSAEEQVRDYFKDIPVMIAIARCESGLRQFNGSGKVLYGGAGMGMIGLFQIDEEVHQKAAKALGFDLATIAGNMGYARHLYETEGTAPWNSDRSCWFGAQGTTTPTTPSAADTKALEVKIGILKKIVALLQQVIELQKLIAQQR